ncbi:MAG: hypothetical protein AB8B65_15695 [Kordia sp.]|uniref:hypothetical protein n=1 Tax=Kordia sp. TaxID=1965332 RepID=UPI00385EFCFE
MKQHFSILYICLLHLFLVSLSCHSQTNVELVSYTASECQDVYAKNIFKLQDRIVVAYKTGNLKTYKLFVVANCSSTAIGKVTLKNDTLNLAFHGIRERTLFEKKKNDSVTTITEAYIEEVADCECAFNLTYTIKTFENQEYVVTANGKKIVVSEHKYKVKSEKPSFQIVNTDTINYVDIYGLKQGVHVTNRNDGQQFARVHYVDDEKISGLASTYYDFDGYGKVETFMEDGKFSIRKYYKNRKLVKTCKTDGSFDEGTDCKYEK